MNSFLWTYENDDGEEIEIHFPAHWAICHTCQGEGKHSLRIGIITQDEWSQEWDYEEQEAYLSGAYDSTCDDCDGTGKIREINEDLAESMLPTEWAMYLEHMRSEAQCNAISAAERRMGA